SAGPAVRGRHLDTWYDPNRRRRTSLSWHNPRVPYLSSHEGKKGVSVPSGYEPSEPGNHNCLSLLPESDWRQKFLPTHWNLRRQNDSRGSRGFPTILYLGLDPQAFDSPAYLGPRIAR